MAPSVKLRKDVAETLPPGPGRARLVFATASSGETFLREQFASYPFHVCRPHGYAKDPPGMATLYLQSLAGGIYQGDRLSLSIAAERAARAHVTTQASTIVQGMEHGSAEQRVTVSAAADSVVEYMPDPTILFPGSRLTSNIRVDLGPGALVMLSDSFLCHDPQGDDRPFESLLSDISFFGPDGAPLLRDRFRVSGPDFVGQLSGVSDARASQGAFYVVAQGAPREKLVEALRAALDGVEAIYGGASLLPSDCGAWVRFAAPDGAALRSALQACWSAARCCLLGSRPEPRRK